MFSPNSTGLLYPRVGYDKYGQQLVGEPIECGYSQVTLKRGSVRTSVRADSSASRGQADEITADARILIVKTVRPLINDHFVADGQRYRILSVFPRRTVFGALDHYECDLEIMP